MLSLWIWETGRLTAGFGSWLGQRSCHKQPSRRDRAAGVVGRFSAFLG
ncbi:hypothetical protein A2U01_0079258, partial [Trifolium medium]|nr:hypothetical protein [Trifolium medium]